jgi:Ala-tRNA(Pro) deacylase
MSMAPSIETHLGKAGIDFSLIPHPHSSNSLQTARVAHVAAKQVAKAVMTHDGDTYRLCLIPSTHRLVLSWLNEHMNGHFRLVMEQELADLFADCEIGAVPALGQVYGFPVIWDSAFSDMDDVFFEGGDHENLVKVDKGAFMQLMAGQEQDRISCEADEYEFRAEIVH